MMQNRTSNEELKDKIAKKIQEVQEQRSKEQEGSSRLYTQISQEIKKTQVNNLQESTSMSQN